MSVARANAERVENWNNTAIVYRLWYNSEKFFNIIISLLIEEGV